MGKKLVIKGADFSENGFTVQEQEIDASTLYYYGYNEQGHPTLPLTEEKWAELSNAETIAFYEKTDGSLVEWTVTGTPKIVSAIANCSGYEKVKVKTMGGFGTQSTISGTAVLLFIDDNNVIKGGYTTRAVNTVSPSGKTQGVGVPASLTEFEMNVPEGATKVVSTYKNTTGSPFVSPDIFEMKLIRLVVG